MESTRESVADDARAEQHGIVCETTLLASVGQALLTSLSSSSQIEVASDAKWDDAPRRNPFRQALSGSSGRVVSVRSSRRNSRGATGRKQTDMTGYSCS